MRACWRAFCFAFTVHDEELGHGEPVDEWRYTCDPLSPALVYATQLGDAKSFGLRAAAVCAKPGKKEGPLGKCEKTYFSMLAKAEL